MTFFVKKVCKFCGSDKVKADAYAAWDAVTQEWQVSGTFDKGAHCDKCDGETRIVDAPLDGDELIEARARYLALGHGWQPCDEDTAIEYCDTFGGGGGLDPTKPITQESDT